MKNRFYLVLVLAALMCLVGWSARAQYPTRSVPRQAWEHTVVQGNSNYLLTSKLNELGQEGWQLVAVSSCPNLPQTTVDCKIAYLKREK